jgi:hypothetical protein
VPPIVSEHQPPAVQHAVCDRPDEGRRHDRASGVPFVERLHARHGVPVLLDELLDEAPNRRPESEPPESRQARDR